MTQYGISKTGLLVRAVLIAGIAVTGLVLTYVSGQMSTSDVAAMWIGCVGALMFSASVTVEALRKPKAKS